MLVILLTPIQAVVQGGDLRHSCLIGSILSVSSLCLEIIVALLEAVGAFFCVMFHGVSKMLASDRSDSSAENKKVT